MSLDFLDNLEINRIQVMGEKFAFVWCFFLVAALGNGIKYFPV